MLLIFQVVSGAAWAVYRLMQDTPVRYTWNSNHMWLLHSGRFCPRNYFDLHLNLVIMRLELTRKFYPGNAINQKIKLRRVTEFPVHYLREVACTNVYLNTTFKYILSRLLRVKLISVIISNSNLSVGGLGNSPIFCWRTRSECSSS